MKNIYNLILPKYIYIGVQRTMFYKITKAYVFGIYRNDPKFSDRQVWANSVLQSDQGLHCLQAEIRLQSD